MEQGWPGLAQYTPSNPANWNPRPRTVQDALDELAADVAALPTLFQQIVAIESNNVQQVGPLSAPGVSVHFDTVPYALLPSIAALGGSPAVDVAASASVTGITPGNVVLWQLVRDRATAPVILAQQDSEISAAAGDTATITLNFLDTANAVDAVSLAPAGLVDGSLHTYSIVATAAATLTQTVGIGALVKMEQKLAGRSSTFGAVTGGVNLGTAGLFASFGSAGITNSGPSDILGDIGTPATSTSLTGFALTVDSSNTFATSSQVVGRVYAADYVGPPATTPAKVTQANTDMLEAYTDASTRTPGTTNLNGGLLGGQTVTPGIYKWTTAVTIDGTPLTLNGAGIYIFIITGTLELAAANAIVLAGGALPQNVFWAVAGAVTIHAGASFQGALLGATSIALQAGATARGRLLSQTGVTLLSNVIFEQ